MRQTGHRNKGIFNYSIVFVLLFVTFLLPVYPWLANAFYYNTPVQFYRGDIDESSILESYSPNILPGEDLNTTYLDDSMWAFFTVDTILDAERNNEWSNEIVDYTIRPWESYDSIAADFGVSVNSILWANNFTKSHVIHPWDVIKIPPVTWLIYTVQKWDTLEAIAKKYKIAVVDIEKQNKISKDSDILKIGQQIVLPNAQKIIPKPVVKPRPPVKSSKRTPARSYTPPTSSVDGSYQLVWRKPLPGFAWGNCTWFVAQYKNVTWRGNANRWLANARAQWVPTGNTPKPWAIVQFSGRWYNLRYGHVGIVTSVNGDTMIVRDMNYRAVNQITNRKVSIYDRSIDGYIYVD